MSLFIDMFRARGCQIAGQFVVGLCDEIRAW